MYFHAQKNPALASRAQILAGVGGVEPPITESKSVALPLGYTPIKGLYLCICRKKNGVSGGDRTHA